MLAFASDLGIEPSDVTEYMWLCEEALSADVVNPTACKRLFSLRCVSHTDGAVFQLKNWEPHSDSKGDVYFFDTETETSVWEHPLAEYYHNVRAPCPLLFGSLES